MTSPIRMALDTTVDLLAFLPPSQSTATGSLVTDDLSAGAASTAMPALLTSHPP